MIGIQGDFFLNWSPQPPISRLLRRDAKFVPSKDEEKRHDINVGSVTATPDFVLPHVLEFFTPSNNQYITQNARKCFNDFYLLI